MDALLASMSRHITISDALKQELTQRITPHFFQKKELVHDAQSICRRSYFIESGILRLYYLKDGNEITEFFCGERDWANSPRSFMQQRSDVYYIDAIEDTSVLSLSVHDLVYLFEHFREMEKYARLDMGQTFAHLMDRLAILRFTSPREKYEHFLESYSDIHHRIPLGMVASYLGIAQETLSRIRRQH